MEQRDYEAFVEQCYTYLKEAQAKTWNGSTLQEMDSFFYDQEMGVIQFFKNEQVAIVADIQIIGSLSTHKSTWLWSWGNTSVLPVVTMDAEIARAYGKDNDIDELQVASWPAKEVDGWAMVAVAAYLTHADGAYRIPEENGYIYIVFHNARQPGILPDVQANSLEISVSFILEQDEQGYPPVTIEYVPAKKADNGTYQIIQPPFFARTANMGDVVATYQHKDALVFAYTVSRSENSLVRIIYYDESRTRDTLRKLSKLGCAIFTHKQYSIIAISIPKEVNLTTVQKFLASGYDKGFWDYEEPILRQ